MKIIDGIVSFLFNLCLLLSVAIGSVFAIASSPAYYYEQFERTGIYTTVNEQGVETPKRIYYIGGDASKYAEFTDEQLNQIIDHIISYLFTDADSFALTLDDVSLNGKVTDDVAIFGEVAIRHMVDVKVLLQTLGYVALSCGIAAACMLAYFIVRAIRGHGGILFLCTLLFYGTFVGLIGLFCLIAYIDLLSVNLGMEYYFSMLWRNFHFIIFPNPEQAMGSFFNDTLTIILSLDLFMAAVIRVLLIIGASVLVWMGFAFFLDRHVKRIQNAPKPVEEGTRYPIILAHGILMKQSLFRAFVHIQKCLTELGYHVYIANTDGVGTIEGNANQLKKQIEDILEKENAEKINIIAHSKGGLDSIYMIENLSMVDKVASLTTLCTPHKGSQLATKIIHLPSFLLHFMAFWVNVFYKYILRDEHPDVITACKQLESKVEITAGQLAAQEVYCQSYSATMHKASSDFVLSIPFLLSRRLENDFSDGMVGKTSAQFAEYKGDCCEESVSHNEVVCFMTKKKKKERVVAFYQTLCKDLKARGF